MRHIIVVDATMDGESLVRKLPNFFVIPMKVTLIGSYKSENMPINDLAEFCGEYDTSSDNVVKK